MSFTGDPAPHGGRDTLGEPHPWFESGTGTVPQQREGDAAPTAEYDDWPPHDDETVALRQIPTEPGFDVPPGPDETVALRQISTEPGFVVPPVPEAGWDMDPSRRRTWVSRCLLGVILLVQAILSLRLHNTAFQDEALYLYAGHAEIAHLLHGTPLPIDYNAYFSGSPVLYPVLAAAVDSHFGLFGARVLSLLFMLGTSALLYSMTRRMFNERAALAAAAVFAVAQSTVVLGNFATYDAAALFLLALTTWIVVRTDRAPMVAVMLAAPTAVLAVAVKYAAALYLPTIVLLAVLSAWPHRGFRSLWRGVLLGVGVAAVGGIALYYTAVLRGVQTTTTNRAHGTDSLTTVFDFSAQWSGLVFLTACAGAWSYTRRGRMNESPLSWRLSGPGWRRRLILGLVLCGSALLAPAYQAHLQTTQSLFKHVGFGLLFAAPMAGVGLTRLVGAHFRYPQLGILLWVVLLCLGLAQSQARYAVWPDSSALVATLKTHVDDKGHYLATAYEVPLYYLRDQTSQQQWTSTYNITYRDKKGRSHSGNDGYATAISEGYFNLVVLDGTTTKDTDAFVAAQLDKSAHYRLLAALPFRNGWGSYRIWVRTG